MIVGKVFENVAAAGEKNLLTKPFRTQFFPCWSCVCVYCDIKNVIFCLTVYCKCINYQSLLIKLLLQFLLFCPKKFYVWGVHYNVSKFGHRSNHKPTPAAIKKQAKFFFQFTSNKQTNKETVFVLNFISSDVLCAAKKNQTTI